MNNDRLIIYSPKIKFIFLGVAAIILLGFFLFVVIVKNGLVFLGPIDLLTLLVIVSAVVILQTGKVFFNKRALAIFALIVSLFLISVYKEPLQQFLGPLGFILDVVNFVTLATLFFGIGVAFILYRIITPRPALIIDKNGITDNSAFLSLGKVEWEEIKELIVGTSGKQLFLNTKFLGILPRDEQKFLNKYGKLHQLLLMLGKGLSVTPFAIMEQNIDIPIEQLLAQIKEKFDPQIKKYSIEIRT